MKGLYRDESPNWSEEVIHGYIDPADYTFNDTPDDYFLYLARVEDNYASGNYSIQYNANNLSSGVYFVELKDKNTAVYSKIILLK